MATTEGCPVSILCQDEGSVMRDREEWKQVAAGSCKRNPSLPSQLPLQNRYEALSMVDNGNDHKEEEESASTLTKFRSTNSSHQSCIKTSAEKKQQ